MYKVECSTYIEISWATSCGEGRIASFIEHNSKRKALTKGEKKANHIEYYTTPIFQNYIKSGRVSTYVYELPTYFMTNSILVCRNTGKNVQM